jgi:glycosyltransferase involved in cell wall biosynthesis
MPVVASDRIGKDVIEHEVNGLLVPTRDSQALVDAVERLITDRRFCQELGERAQAKARNYTWDRIAARYESLYERLLEDCQR